MAKRNEKEHVIEYEMELEDLEAAEKAAREQYEETLYLVNMMDTLPSLDEIEEEHSILEDGDFTGTAETFETRGHIYDLKKDLETWTKAVNALLVAKFEAKAGVIDPRGEPA
jgi:hypothetical protein